MKVAEIFESEGSHPLKGISSGAKWIRSVASKNGLKADAVEGSELKEFWQFKVSIHANEKTKKEFRGPGDEGFSKTHAAFFKREKELVDAANAEIRKEVAALGGTIKPWYDEQSKDMAYVIRIPKN
jgi:hypothetical protein